MSRLPRLLAATIGLITPLATRADDPAISADDAAFFEAKIRPILAAKCDGCHSATAKTLRGGLRLDSKPGWQKGGDSGPAIEPGKPEESLLVAAVKYDDEALQMPPAGKLPDAAIADLAEWVRRGAPDPRATEPAVAAAAKPARVIDLDEGRRWWAFQPLRSPEPPAVKGADRVRNPIDAFLLTALEAKGLGYAPEADRRTLVRRLTFDLTGLPPTPEEIVAFEADDRPDAYERLVDRLLASPRYGERWARHWLDLARFGESHGFEHDYDRPTAYTYRDFLIEAFNRDLPYDRFVSWQLAGDELAPDDPLAMKATGFLAAGVHSTQITANQVEKERYDELDDMLAVTTTAFLGLTVGCARCHDHKFDPIPVDDYYRMLATFTTTVRTEVDLKPKPDELAAAQARHAEQKRAAVEALAAFESDELPARLSDWEASRPPSMAGPRWVVLEPTKLESAGKATFERLADGSIRVGGPNAEFDAYTIVAACDLDRLTGLRLEALADDGLVARGPGRAANGNFALTDLKFGIGPRYGLGKSVDPPLANPQATFEQPGLPIAATIDADPKSGWAVDPQFGHDHAAVYELADDRPLDGGATLTIKLDFRNNAGHNLGRFRLAVTDSPRPVGLDASGLPPAVAPILSVATADRSPEQTAALLGWYRTIDPEWRARKQSLDALIAAEPKAEGTKALLCSEGLPPLRLHTQGADFFETTYHLRRGDPGQKAGPAEPGFLQVLGATAEVESRWHLKPPEGARTSFRRAGLAAWMTDVDHGAGPLLARVAANRLWHHHYGRGIVATPSDFGAQGERPTHPELLDWLAARLVADGWSIKALHRQILTSSAYRQSSALPPSAADPENRLLGRQNRQRLEGEAIRDSLLAVAGVLDERMYGPGTLDEAQRRRSVYFTVKRSKLIPMMTLFDAPDALSPVAARPTTTVAPQSLLLLNSPGVRSWAAAFGRRVRPSPGSALGDAVGPAYRLALGRLPDPAEQAAASAFLDAQAAAYRSEGRPDPEGAALADFAQVVFGLNEFVYVD